MYKEPYYFFTKKDFSNENFYNKGVSLIDMFIVYGTGFSTNSDKLSIDYSKDELLAKLKYLAYLEEENYCSKYVVEKDGNRYCRLKEIQEFFINLLILMKII
ncbi:hypothetical protein QIA45_05100 (plasmid) [Borreliella andersonii]|uniref:Uncharacterized protein n=2 Tax=Borrelia andersonii TaxID=42109 RepID=A0ACD5G6D2_BORAD